MANDPLRETSTQRNSSSAAGSPMGSLRGLLGIEKKRKSFHVRSQSERFHFLDPNSGSPSRETQASKIAWKGKEFNKWLLVKQKLDSARNSPSKGGEEENSFLLPTKKKKLFTNQVVTARPFNFTVLERSKSEFSRQLLDNLLKQQDLDIIKNFYKKLYDTKEKDYKVKINNTLGTSNLYMVHQQKKIISPEPIKNVVINKSEILSVKQQLEILDGVLKTQAMNLTTGIKTTLSKKKQKIRTRDRLVDAFAVAHNFSPKENDLGGGHSIKVSLSPQDFEKERDLVQGVVSNLSKLHMAITSKDSTPPTN